MRTNPYTPACIVLHHSRASSDVYPSETAAVLHLYSRIPLALANKVTC